MNLRRVIRESRYVVLWATVIPLIYLEWNNSTPLFGAGSPAPVLMAFVAGLGFALLLWWAFPGAELPFSSIVSALTISGAATIPLVFGIQWLAKISTDYPFFSEGGRVVFYDVEVIIRSFLTMVGKAYEQVNIGTDSFALSLLAFTLSVGLIEEFAKQAPLAFFEHRITGVREAAALAFASGFGFGIAEGVLYSFRHYNGVFGWEAYVVRFVSLAGLHGCWSATVAVLWRSSGTKEIYSLLDYSRDEWGMALFLLLPIAFIHGLYDVYLTFGRQFEAEIVAGLSMVALIILFERKKVMERRVL